MEVVGGSPVEEGGGGEAALLAEEGKGGGKMPSSLNGLKGKPLINAKLTL